MRTTQQTVSPSLKPVEVRPLVMKERLPSARPCKVNSKPQNPKSKPQNPKFKPLFLNHRPPVLLENFLMKRITPGLRNVQLEPGQDSKLQETHNPHLRVGRAERFDLNGLGGGDTEYLSSDRESRKVRPEWSKEVEKRKMKDPTGQASNVATHQPPDQDQPEQLIGAVGSSSDSDSERREQYYREHLPETWSAEALSYLQKRDPDLRKVRAWFSGGGKPSWNQVAKENTTVKTWWSRYDQLLLSSNGVLYLQWENESTGKPPWYRVVAVASMFKAILMELHDAKTAGHLGQKKTIERLKRSPFYWPGMGSYARRWVQGCVVCAAKKNPRHSKRSPLQGYRVGSVMDRVSIDLTGPFKPRTRSGNQWILTVTDQFSRWCEAFALREAKAQEIAKRVVDFICRMGVPLEIHSDQGRNVDGEIMREVCRLLGVRKTHTTAYHPQGNAITERENAVLKQLLSAYVNVRLNDWDEHLPVIMLAYRSAVHRTLGEAPFTVLMGRKARLPLDAFIGAPPEVAYQEVSMSEYVTGLMEAMQQAHELVSDKMDTAYAYQKKQYDRQVQAQTFEKAQPVWLRVYPNLRNRSRSLLKPWDPGWIVVNRVSDVTYRIQKRINGWAPVVHGDRLKPFMSEIIDPETLKLQRSLQKCEAGH